MALKWVNGQLIDVADEQTPAQPPAADKQEAPAEEAPADSTAEPAAKRKARSKVAS
jgi:hypothetical protein